MMAQPLRQISADRGEKSGPTGLLASTSFARPLSVGPAGKVPVAEVPMTTRGSRFWPAGIGLDQSGRGTGSYPPARKMWQFLGLAEIANFVELRRYLGKA